jgi:hypothetical protein
MRVGLLIGYFAVKLTPVVRRHASMIYRCVLPLLIGFACVEVYDFLRESEIDLPYLRFKDEYRESFYSGVATLYAIITALALVKGIEDFDSLKRTIADEVFTIREIVNLAIYLRGGENPETMPSLRSIKKMLADYALNVARKHDLAAAGPNDAILRECQSEIGKLRRERGGEADAISLIMKAHSDLSTLRARRIDAVGEKIPIYLIVALWIMALGLILPFMVMPVAQSGAVAFEFAANEPMMGQYYIIFLMGALNSFLLLMLSDISDPFDGFWKVRLEAFDTLYASLRDEIENESVAVPLA